MPVLCSILQCRNASTVSRTMDAKFFSIPKAERDRRKWMEWIMGENAPAVHTVKNPHLCNKHFSEQCFLPTGRLARGSIPSISVRCRTTSPTQQGSNCSSAVQESITLGALLGHSEPVLRCNISSRPQRAPVLSTTHECLSVLSCSGSQCVLKKHNTVNVSPAFASVQSADGNLKDTTHSLEVETSIGSRAGKLEEAIDTQPSLPQINAATPLQIRCCSDFVTPERKASKGRKKYVGDLSPSDFSTPRRAEKYLGLAKATVNGFKRRLHIANAKNHRLRAKVQSLEGLVQHLRNEAKLIDGNIGTSAQVT